MADTPDTTNQNPTDGNPPADQNNGGGQNGDTPKTFSQEDVDKIVAKRVSEVNSKTDETISKKIAEAQAEWERKAKLTEEEKANEAQQAKIKELEERDHSITMRERRAEALTDLVDKNIPTDFVDYVIDTDEAKTKANIEKLAKVWSKSIEEGVKAKLEGTTPSDKSRKPTQSGGSNVGRDNGQGVTSF